MAFIGHGFQDRGLEAELSLCGEDQVGPLLTLPIEQQTTVLGLKEFQMADEEDTITDTEVPTGAAPDVSKKQRKPRARKTTAEAKSGETAVETATGKPKRGRKSKSDQGMSGVKHLPVARALKAAQTVISLSNAAIDEITDLRRLEEENQRLRKLLVEKLRAENADLRKRLNLG